MMIAKKKAAFSNTEVASYCVAGTAGAFEALGRDGDDVHCVVCGARIKYIFLTNHGPMGGDCLATITGDRSTRQAVRRLVAAVTLVVNGYNHNGIAIAIKPSHRSGERTVYIYTCRRGRFDQYEGIQYWNTRCAKAIKVGQIEERIIRAIIQDVIDVTGVAVRTK